VLHSKIDLQSAIFVLDALVSAFLRYKLRKFDKTLIFSVFVSFCISCAGTGQLHTGSAEPITIRNRMGLFDVTIPAGAVSNHFQGDNFDVDVFEWWQGQVSITRISIFVRSSGFPDHLSPDYESYFQKNCGCKILKKGWVLFSGQKGREFMYTIDDDKRVGIERHIQWKGTMIQLQGLSLSANQDLLKERLQKVQSSLVLRD